MARRPRLAAQAAAASLRTPIPRLSDNEDEDMLDTPPVDASTPQDDANEDEDNGTDDPDDDENEPDEDAPTPSRSERVSRSGTPRRRGRPPGLNTRVRRGRQSIKRNDSEENANDNASDTTTPRRRGGFRGHRGGRWGKPRGGPTRNAHLPVDEDGNVLNIVDDEVELPDDPEGEEKVDKNGRLLGGREYRVRTFTIFGRDERLYMLSTEPARCIGFRDSYLFFQKHKHLYKIIIDDDEKRDLIDRDLIPHSYKGRAIGVVTARSVFREFGARIVIGGKRVVDDYDVQGARERGDVEGEVAVPEDRLPAPGEPYNRNQYVAWHGASAVYHTNLPSVPMQNGKAPEVKRRKITVTSDNWMLEHAREASRFNSLLTLSRRDVERGIYDIHTNQMQEAADLQPTHGRWEVVPPLGASNEAAGEGEGYGQDSKLNDDDNIKDEGNQAQDNVMTKNTNLYPAQKLKPLAPIYSRNFCIQDLFLESSPATTYASRSNTTTSTNGTQTSSLSSIPQSILDELPSECRVALEAEISREIAWSRKWTNEDVCGHRAHILGSVDWFPK